MHGGCSCGMICPFSKLRTIVVLLALEGLCTFPPKASWSLQLAFGQRMRLGANQDES